MPQSEPSAPAVNPRRFFWRRPPLQYRLRTLLVVVTIVAVLLGWWSYSAFQQRDAIAAIEKRGGHVYVRGSLGNSDLARLLQQLTPRDYQFYPYETYLESATDADMEYVSRLVKLEKLELFQSTLSEVGLKRLGRLTRLRLLNFVDCQLDDAGLEKLKGLSDLRVLGLSGTQITDAGLTHLEGLSRLTILYIGGTRVTDAGVARLKQSLPHCSIICR